MTEAEHERHEPPAPAGAILVINSGSSSVKFALFADDEILPRLWSGGIDRIGMANGRLRAFDGASAAVLDERRSVADHEQALTLLLETIEQHPSGAPLAAVGHRVVHGGPDCDCPAVVTGTLEAKLLQLSPLAPLHQPHNLAGIAAVRGARPGLPQVACFDTAFHHGLPRFATLTALPRDFHGDGVRRYGFHGLSYEYITGALRRAGIPRRRRRRRHRRGARRSRGPNLAGRSGAGSACVPGPGRAHAPPGAEAPGGEVPDRRAEPPRGPAARPCLLSAARAGDGQEFASTIREMGCMR